MHRSDAHVGDTDVRVTGYIHDHGSAGHDSSVVIYRQDRMGGPGVRKYWWIWENNGTEGFATAAANQIKTQHEPQPEKPLHSNSVEKVKCGIRYCIGNRVARGNQVTIIPLLR
jgi:hypothetical protein